MTHLNSTVLTRYATGGTGLDDATVWAVEVHLEACATCRGQLAGDLPGDTLGLLDRVAAGIDREIEAGPPPVGKRRRLSAVQRRWTAGSLMPWLTVTVAILGCAVLLDDLRTGLPTVLLMLIAPIAPLPGVAVAWSRRLDPAWEMVAGTPTAGIAMLLRRTLVVLLVVTPSLGLAGMLAGVSTALLLVPSLAFTAATITLGSFVGVRRAAVIIGSAWGLGVIVPSLATLELPVLLQPGSVPVWALVTVLLAGLAAFRTDSFRRLLSWR